MGAAVGLDPKARSKLAHALLLASNDVLCGSEAKDLLQNNDSSTPSLWFRTLLLAYYVIIGSATFLVVRLTETHGKLSYNTSVAVLLTEGLKLLVARGLAFTTETQRERQAARGVSWVEAQILKSPMYSDIIYSKVYQGTYCQEFLPSGAGTGRQR